MRQRMIGKINGPSTRSVHRMRRPRNAITRSAEIPTGGSIFDSRTIGHIARREFLVAVVLGDVGTTEYYSAGSN